MESRAGRARPLGSSRTLRRIGRQVRKPRIADEADAFYAAVADQVVEQRIARDLSQGELAELCGTTQSAIARLERGARPPRIDTLLRVANALDCELVVELKPRTKVKGKR